MSHHDADPLFEELAALSQMTLRTSVDRRIRHRCHAVLTGRRLQPHPSRSVRLTDMLGATAVAFYIAALITEAVRLIG